MTPDAWPSPDSSGPLPRIEDLPLAEQGYDLESVRAAFDSFYRHAAQLDASLRALEAVEVFRRDADALRNDLRALRSLGFGGGWSEPSWNVDRYETRRRAEVPPAVFRLAAEAALIVAVAVVAGVSHLRPVVIVALMAVAFVIVALAEWLASRSRFVPPAALFLPAAPAGEPAPYVEAPAPGWGGALEPDEDTEPEAMTIVAARAELEQGGADVVDPWEEGAADDGDVVDPEPELAGRGGLFRRRRR
ncbi:MAG TPA: hypothetical protein VGN27_01105 [Gaiellaceae bacterium]|jgi:hypothetical protein|nr:hypothetical protein [Gaiellaceae bacterium]